jgi:hypothetical protein
MAEVVAVIASTHHPFYYRASRSTGDERPPFADEWVAKIERIFNDSLRVFEGIDSEHDRAVLQTYENYGANWVFGFKGTF